MSGEKKAQHRAVQNDIFERLKILIAAGDFSMSERKVSQEYDSYYVAGRYSIKKSGAKLDIRMIDDQVEFIKLNGKYLPALGFNNSEQLKDMILARVLRYKKELVEKEKAAEDKKNYKAMGALLSKTSAFRKASDTLIAEKRAEIDKLAALKDAAALLSKSNHDKEYAEILRKMVAQQKKRVDSFGGR